MSAPMMTRRIPVSGVSKHASALGRARERGLVLALRIDLDSHPQPCCQHHDPHDALGIDALRPTGDENITVIATRKLGELGGCTRMQSQFV